MTASVTLLHRTYQHRSIIDECRCCTVSPQLHARTAPEDTRHGNTSSSCALRALQTAANDGDAHHHHAAAASSETPFMLKASESDRARDVMLLLRFPATVSVTIDLVSVTS